jgi:hypothetical protein
MGDWRRPDWRNNARWHNPRLTVKTRFSYNTTTQFNRVYATVAPSKTTPEIAATGGIEPSSDTDQSQ